MEEEVSAFNAAILICIPKKVVHQGPDGSSYYLPQQLRPLSIVNTDNRLVASAARLRFEAPISQAIGSAQRGFLKGRSMLLNVLLVDTRLRTACAESDHAGAVFFDFEAAFPSLAHRYLHATLEKLGLPASVSNLVRSLYFGHGCQVTQQGFSATAFPVQAGIRQGCPLSPLLFALAIEPLLRALQKAEPSLLVCAYADDIAAVSSNLEGMLATAAPIFAAFGRASGLHLNQSKTVVLPLGSAAIPEVQHWLRSRLDWVMTPVQHWAEYLGFFLGPDAEGKGWNKVFRKMQDRVALWAGVGTVFFWGVTAYNTYILSLAGFLLQLEPLPATWPAVEAALLRRMFPGPAAGTHGWIRPLDLHTVDQIGMPAAVRDLAAVSLAARFRVTHREALAEGGIRIQQLLRKIHNAERDATGNASVIRLGRWRQWYTHSFAANLQEACHSLDRRGINIGNVEAGLAGDMQQPLTEARARRLRRGVQGAVVRSLHAAGPQPWHRRLRARLEIFKMPLLPGSRPVRALRTMERLPNSTPPRVRAAIIRTWLHGWCTERRFQNRNSQCMWGCQYAQDDLLHYVDCRRLRDAAAQALQLPCLADGASGTEDFLLLRPGADEPLARLAQKARRLAAAYLLHCRQRHDRKAWRALTAAGRVDAFRQMDISLR